MSTYVAGTAFIVVLVAGLAASHVPLGDYMARVYMGDRHLRVGKLMLQPIQSDGDLRLHTFMSADRRSAAKSPTSCLASERSGGRVLDAAKAEMAGRAAHLLTLAGGGSVAQAVRRCAQM